MYIVKKKINGKEYFYLNKSVREDGKVRSKSVAYLGKDKEEAERKADELKKAEVSGNIDGSASEGSTGSFDVGESGKNVGSKGYDSDEKSEKDKKSGKGVRDIKKSGDGKLSIDELAAFCKRKGFVYPSGEIYGGLGGFWDFGHLGSELKGNLKREWWKYHVYRGDIVGIDGSIITNPKIWSASGHVDSFVDVAVVCKKCKNKSKVDKHEIGQVACDKCGGEFESKGEFNPMFKTKVGPVAEESMLAYLRPETAQLIFADFKSVMDNARMRVPFGIAQIGKAFRNEISPREFLFRSREFEQMEIEYFIKEGMDCPYVDEVDDVELLVYDEEMQLRNLQPKMMKIVDALKKKIIKFDWHGYWIAKEFQWFISLGAKPSNFRIRQHTKDEKSHYAIDTWDLEYNFPMGWRELQGFANRGDFDLSSHQKISGESMEVLDSGGNESGLRGSGSGKKFIPHVVCEPSLGVERAFLVFLFDAYSYDSKRENIVLKLHPKLAPVKAAVFPIVKDEKYIQMAEEIVDNLSKEMNVVYDKSGSIGRRYSRNDEIGTPFCITIDELSGKQKDVTVRDRDTTEQVRVKIADLKGVLREVIESGKSILEFGKKVKTRVK
jgi:glycyl-tRNA synthetase